MKYKFKNDVMKVMVTDFLRVNPTESIAMRVKKDKGSGGKAASETLRDILLTYKNYIIPKRCVGDGGIGALRLGGDKKNECDLRGKMLVFVQGYNRDSIGGDAHTSKWKPPGSDVQDHYEVFNNMYDFKFGKIKSHLISARTRPEQSTTTYINHLSGTGLPSSFPYVHDAINLAFP